MIVTLSLNNCQLEILFWCESVLAGGSGALIEDMPMYVCMKVVYA